MELIELRGIKEYPCTQMRCDWIVRIFFFFLFCESILIQFKHFDCKTNDCSSKIAASTPSKATEWITSEYKRIYLLKHFFYGHLHRKWILLLAVVVIIFVFVYIWFGIRGVFSVFVPSSRRWSNGSMHSHSDRWPSGRTIAVKIISYNFFRALHLTFAIAFIM